MIEVRRRRRATTTTRQRGDCLSHRSLRSTSHPNPLEQCRQQQRYALPLPCARPPAPPADSSPSSLPPLSCCALSLQDPMAGHPGHLTQEHKAILQQVRPPPLAPWDAYCETRLSLISRRH